MLIFCDKSFDNRLGIGHNGFTFIILMAVKLDSPKLFLEIAQSYSLPTSAEVEDDILCETKLEVHQEK